MQTSVLGQAAAAGVRLVISVDTGIRAFAAADEAKALGLDLIVTHHLPDDAVGVPEAVAVLNPARQNCSYPFKLLCGPQSLSNWLTHCCYRQPKPRTIQMHSASASAQLIPSF